MACLCLLDRDREVNENVEPLPTCDSTQILPPCISMIRLEIAAPSPVPPFFLVIELSACWNSWNSFSWSASEMPGPGVAHRTCEGPVRRPTP